jgi:hypothetical protein
VPVAAAVTATVALCEADPPLELVQLSVYVVAAVSALVLAVPLVDSLPDHPPDAVQDVASVVDQVNVELPPLVTLAGLALIEMLGGVGATEVVVDCDGIELLTPPPEEPAQAARVASIETTNIGRRLRATVSLRWYWRASLLGSLPCSLVSDTGFGRHQ